jgi:hypothetical protein
VTDLETIFGYRMRQRELFFSERTMLADSDVTGAFKVNLHYEHMGGKKDEKRSK